MAILLRQLPLDRHDELSQLAETFARAAQMATQLGELQQKDQLRREMVASVSHGLRTPLTSLHGFLETMQRKAGSLPPLEQQDFLSIALRQTEKVSRLAQDLFELAKLECDVNTLIFARFSLNELMQDVIQKHRLNADLRRVNLMLEFRHDLPLVNGDIGLVERVMTNLIDNALRHTPADGEVRLGASVQGSNVEIFVRDTGCGIAAEYLSTLFDWDSPLSRRSRSVAGGFGLMVVGKIVRLHGGKPRASSELGQGSEFRFDLPAATDG